MLESTSLVTIGPNYEYSRIPLKYFTDFFWGGTVGFGSNLGFCAIHPLVLGYPDSVRHREIPHGMGIAGIGCQVAMDCSNGGREVQQGLVPTSTFGDLMAGGWGV